MIQIIDGVEILVGGGTSSPGGLNTDIQFNDSGVLGGDSKLQWDKVASALKVGEGVTPLPNNPIAVQANVDSYLQLNIKNDSLDVAASSDYIATADDGDDTQFYADIGIGNSNYLSDVWDVVGAHDTYVFGDGGHVAIGSLSVGKEIKFFIAQTEHEAHPADISAKVDSDGINLPSGKTYRINGVDILSSGMSNPMTASGDIIYGGTAGAPTALAKGTDGEVLKLVSGIPSWEAEGGLVDADYGDVTVSSGVWTIDSGVVTEGKIGLSDVTTNNASVAKHGYLPKLSGNASQVLLGDGTFGTSPGTGLTKDVIGVTVDGGGSAISTGSKGYKVIQEACTITGWTILGKEAGSCVVDIKKCNYAGFPSTASIAGSEKPTLSSAQKNQDLTLSTWTTSLSEGDILEFTVDSASTVTRINLFINITK